MPFIEIPTSGDCSADKARAIGQALGMLFKRKAGRTHTPPPTRVHEDEKKAADKAACRGKPCEDCTCDDAEVIHNVSTTQDTPGPDAARKGKGNE